MGAPQMQPKVLSRYKAFYSVLFSSVAPVASFLLDPSMEILSKNSLHDFWSCIGGCSEVPQVPRGGVCSPRCCKTPWHPHAVHSTPWPEYSAALAQGVTM